MLSVPRLARRGLIFGIGKFRHGRRDLGSNSASDYFPHQDAARPSDLLKTLGKSCGNITSYRTTCRMECLRN